MIEVAPLEPTDENDVGSLFRNQGMKFAGLTLNYDRGAEFRRLLSLQAPRYQTYLAKEASHLRSLISLTSGPRWYNRTIHEVGFISDFRIDHSPQARAVWRELLTLVVEKFDMEFMNKRPQLLFALILKGNKAALRSFNSSRSTTQFQMREVSSVRMINIFARLRSAKRNSGYQVARCTSADKLELIQFLKLSEQNRQLGYVFDDAEFCESKFRHGSWNFHWTDFLVLRKVSVGSDQSPGAIQACVLPWAPQDATKVMSFTKAPKILEMSLKLLSRLGWKVPLRGEPIKTLYLTHLNLAGGVSPDDAISKFLDFIYSTKLDRAYQMVSFPDWWRLGARSASLKRALYQTIDVGIYSIGVAGRELVEASPDQIFNFEMAVI